MGKREKQLKKRIEGLKHSIQKHEEKSREYRGENPVLKGYWEKEIEQMEREKVKAEQKLKHRKSKSGSRSA